MRRRQSDTLSIGEARRIAIAAQGADRGAARDAATRGDVRRLIDKICALQIDSVNVLARAHTLPVYARLGVCDRTDLDHLAYSGRQRRLFEYWGHAASLMPVGMQPLFRWRMEDALAGKNIYSGLVRFAEANKALIRDLKREIEQSGPSAVGDFASHGNAQAGW